MDQTLLSCLSPFHRMGMAAFSQADLAEVVATTAIGYIARGLSSLHSLLQGCLSGVPQESPYPRAVRASQVEPG